MIYGYITSGNIPTKLSDLINDTNFITINTSNLSNYYTKTISDEKYIDLTNIPSSITLAGNIFNCENNLVKLVSGKIPEELYTLPNYDNIYITQTELFNILSGYITNTLYDTTINKLTSDILYLSDLISGLQAEHLLEIFYSFSGATPSDALPLTGGTIENCKERYPIFWNKLIELSGTAPIHTINTIKETSGSLIPIFNSNTENGFIIHNSNETDDAYKSFTINNTYDCGILSSNIYWLSLEFPENELNYLSGYTIWTSIDEEAVKNNITEWVIEGSNDNINWNCIDYQNNFINYQNNINEPYTFITNKFKKGISLSNNNLLYYTFINKLNQNILIDYTSDSNTLSIELPCLSTLTTEFYSEFYTNINDKFELYKVNELNIPTKKIKLANEFNIDININNIDNNLILNIPMSEITESNEIQDLPAGKYMLIRVDINMANNSLNNYYSLNEFIDNPQSYKIIRFRPISNALNSTNESYKDHAYFGKINFINSGLTTDTYSFGQIRILPEEEYNKILNKYGEVGGFIINQDTGNVKLPVVNRFISSIENLSEIGNTYTFQDIQLSGNIGPIYSLINTKTGVFSESNNSIYSGIMNNQTGTNIIFNNIQTIQNLNGSIGNEIYPAHIKLACYIRTGFDLSKIQQTRLYKTFLLVNNSNYNEIMNNYLNTIVQARGYTNIYDCISYKDSTIKKYKNDAKAFINYRDNIKLISNKLFSVPLEISENDYLKSLPEINWSN